MDNVTVIPLKTGKQPRRTAKVKTTMSARMLRRLRLQHGVAGVIGIIAAAMTTVSLSHIAGGIAVITHGAVPE